MTFRTSPLAIDGALISSSQLREGTYAGTNGSEGIVGKDDLKVTPLSVPGNGIQIAPGVGLVLNRYQTVKINQTYSVSNPTVHTITSGSMPAVSPSARSFLVCVTIGDPEGSQVGHPWMGANDPPDGTEASFNYVRPWLIQCPGGTKSFTELGLNFPALVLARIDIPGSTSTITSGMITDLRALAQPRTQVAINNATAGSSNPLNGGDIIDGLLAYERWPNQNVVTVKVPEWAVTAKVTGFVEGVLLTKAGAGAIRAAIAETGAATNITNIDESAPVGGSGTDRRSYNVGGTIPITASIRGTTVNFVIQGAPTAEAYKGFLTTTSGATTALLQIIFEEQPT